MFATSIRYLESAAVDMRSRGLLAHELEKAHHGDKSSRIKRLRQGVKADTGDSLLSRDSSVSRLAGDYGDLAAEVMDAITRQESKTTVEVAV